MARKTPLRKPRKPNRGEGIVSKKPRPKSAYDMISWYILLCHCSIVWLCCYFVLRDIHCTSVAQYSLFVLKVSLNNNKLTKPVEGRKKTQTNESSKQTRVFLAVILLICSAWELMCCLMLRNYLYRWWMLCLAAVSCDAV